MPENSSTNVINTGMFIAQNTLFLRLALAAHILIAQIAWTLFSAATIKNETIQDALVSSLLQFALKDDQPLRVINPNHGPPAKSVYEFSLLI